MRVLLVEDEAPLRETLAARLKRDGFAVDAAGDGDEGLYLGREVPFDVAIIDLGLPKLPGMELVKALREAGQRYPILILTARASWQDKVQALKYGADDYLVKPFAFAELLARVRALVRREHGQAANVVDAGPLRLDLSARTASVGGRPLELTARELAVLELLVLNPGVTWSRSAIAERIYDEESDRDSNVIDVFVARLRKKLDAAGAAGSALLKTQRGEGYRFDPDGGSGRA